MPWLSEQERRTVGFLINGLIALAFSLAVWRLTHNFYGWAVLFGPGAVLVIKGIVSLFEQFRRL